MAYYPIFLNIEGRACAVIGGGPVAERKVLSLLTAGGSVTVISPRLGKGLEALVREAKIGYKKSAFKKGMLDGFFLVISASSSEKVNEEVKEEGARLGVMVNVVDAPLLCDFIVPSLVERGELRIAVSTSAKSPALARKLREDLELRYGPEYETFVAILGAVRNKLLKDKRKYGKKDKLYRELVDSEVVQLIKSGGLEEVDEILTSLFGDAFSLAGLGIRTEK